MQIPKSFHKDNRSRTIANFKAACPDLPANSIFFFKGEITRAIHDSDTDLYPQQEANFQYLFGAQEPDLLGIIEIDTGKTTIIAPKINPAYSLWMTVRDLEYYKNFYEIEDSLYKDDIEAYFEKLNPATIYFFFGNDSDSGLQPDLPDFPWLSKYKQDKEILYQALSATRAIKSPQEIEIMKFVNKLSSDAHVRVLKNAKAGLKEYQIEALFKFHNFERSGCRFMAYDCICAGGRDSATLHYICNDKVLVDGALLLADMGGKYYGYSADITVTFPINGKFTKKQKEIYDAVLDAQNAVKQAAKPGVKWEDMHLLAEQTIVNHLTKLGLIKDAPWEEVKEARVGAVFFPHGLGHLLGMRVHDVGAYLKGMPERFTTAGLKSLRTRRTMEKGLVLTIEPGCYFVEYAIAQAKENPNVAKYINFDKVEEYKEVGGVRLEDVGVMTENGFEIISDVPRTTEQVEKCMAGQAWK
jgi:Xaa-Pro dipeptidase